MQRVNFSLDEMQAWVQDKCTPLVREITFENAEELTEEGLPFLILFHHPDDTQSIKDFEGSVRKFLMEDKREYTYSVASMDFTAQLSQACFLCTFWTPSRPNRASSP